VTKAGIHQGARVNGAALVNVWLDAPLPSRLTGKDPMSGRAETEE
jgi:hypothetical protein